MDSEYERSRIEQLKRGLYTPDGEGRERTRDRGLSPSDIHIANDWGDTVIKKEQYEPGEGVRHSRTLKILVTLAVVSALGSAAYLIYEYFDPFANPSEKNIEITFDMPVGATSGIPVDMVVHVANKNRVPLEYANLTVAYPPGTRSGDNPGSDLSEEKQDLGVILPGQVLDYHAKAIFLGEENAEKDVNVTLEFRFAGINSSFTKNEIRPVRILAAPISITVDMLKEVNAGQPLELSVSALSNTVMDLRDVLVKIDYPLGFTFTDADPKPDFGSNIWRVGTLSPSGKFNIKVRGVLSGADTEEKVFHTSAGVGGDRTARDITTLYNKVLSTLSIRRPFIGITLLLNGKPAKDVPVPFGTRVEGKVNWQNNLDTKIEQAQIEVRLRGVALNRPSITASAGGFYRSSDDTIIWDDRGDPSLAILDAGARGTVSFFFQPLPVASGNQLLENPTIVAEVTVRGKRISESGVPEEIKSVMSENVRVSSNVQFASRAVYYTGPFINSGPIPPKVEKETTYTIIWSIVNTSNSISNARVRTVLPVYMKWYGSVSPSKENLTYDRNSNEIVWSPGDIPAGTGISKPPREVAFQVLLTPSLSQVKTLPQLITDTTMTGTDAFTGTPVSQMKSGVTTSLSTDPKATPDSGPVVE